MLALTLVALTVAAGCTTPPAPPPAPPAPKFTPEQVRTMRDLGFVETDAGWTLSLGSRVLFGFGADRLGPDEIETVARLASSLMAVGLMQVRVEGHTDSIGDAAVNQRLSLRRAEVVAREMEARGFPAAGLQARGLGATRPIADNTTEAGRTQNRRVAVIVLSD
jgi:outer membrane protein OmpA-like peptidoglycan-associated protein